MRRDWRCESYPAIFESPDRAGHSSRHGSRRLPKPRAKPYAEGVVNAICTLQLKRHFNILRNPAAVGRSFPSVSRALENYDKDAPFTDVR